MNQRRFFVLISWIAISFLIVVGCSKLTSNNSGNQAAQSQNKQSKSVELTVSAAARKENKD